MKGVCEEEAEEESGASEQANNTICFGSLVVLYGQSDDEGWTGLFLPFIWLVTKGPQNPPFPVYIFFLYCG